VQENKGYTQWREVGSRRKLQVEHMCTKGRHTLRQRWM